MTVLEKNIIRKELSYLRNSQSDTVRDNANSAICRSLSDLSEVKNAGVIAAYMPLGKEVDLSAFFARFAETFFLFSDSSLQDFSSSFFASVICFASSSLRCP